MADLPPYITAIVRSLTHPAAHFMVEPDMLLTDLGFRDDADLCGLRDPIEHYIGADIPTQYMLAWRTVADVAATAARFAGGMTPAIKEAV